LYDPTSGVITLDGVDLRDLDSAALRREIAVIFQDYAHYHLSARDNIWLGNVEAPRDGGWVEAAACQSGADDVIRDLPRGYDSILGKWFEHGQELSMGQWQRVALARAFMRDAQIIVLDEPTSSLDAQAEDEVFRQFRQRARERTSIVISHRFSTVRRADCIYVLDDGHIIERGSHDQLTTSGGIYARMFAAQAKYYR
jgi:ATP-binding cassette subfamily B protein